MIANHSCYRSCGSDCLPVHGVVGVAAAEAVHYSAVWPVVRPSKLLASILADGLQACLHLRNGYQGMLHADTNGGTTSTASPNASKCMLGGILLIVHA